MRKWIASGYGLGVRPATQNEKDPDVGKKKSGGLTKAIVDVGQDEPLTIVTKAKYVDEGKRVVVALVGAVIGDPDDGNIVTKRSVGGVMSEGMLCDSPMLNWTGGAAGQAVFLPEDFAAGSKPPTSRPRGGK